MSPRTVCILAAAILASLSCADRVAVDGLTVQAPPALQEMHVCIDQPNGARDCVALMTDEAPSDNPSPRLMEWVTSAVAGVQAARVNSNPSPEPTRIPQPVAGDWGDDSGPRQPGLTCTCALAVYSIDKTFLGCSVPGCGGCMICRVTS